MTRARRSCGARYLGSGRRIAALSASCLRYSAVQSWQARMCVSTRTASAKSSSWSSTPWSKTLSSAQLTGCAPFFEFYPRCLWRTPCQRKPRRQPPNRDRHKLRELSIEKDRHLSEHQGLSEWRGQSPQRHLYDSRLRGRGFLPAGKMVAAEHNILEKQYSSHMETGGLARLFGPHPRCGARRVTLVMSSSRSTAIGEDLHFSAVHWLRPSPSDAAEEVD